MVVIAFPLIGYFDEHNYGLIHGIVSGIFFLGTVIYSNKLANLFWKNREHFPKEQKSIKRLKTIAKW